mgnify:CR=1 FL=1
MTELELLQQKHREEAARRRAKLKERKKRTHRLIERGAILESVLKEIGPPENMTNEQVQEILYFALLNPEREGRTYDRPSGSVVRPFRQKQRRNHNGNIPFFSKNHKEK